ncbi:MAG: DNA-binding response regulator [Bacteroidetes bacterium]|nr:MAG: DNA-binding response regulator [Bacteroidota bacterium]
MKILVANSEDITGSGLVWLIRSISENYEVKRTDAAETLFSLLAVFSPDILFIDYLSEGFDVEVIKKVKQLYPDLKIIAVTEKTEKRNILKALSFGVSAYLLECCDVVEIKEAINASLKKEQFFCGKILNQLNRTESFDCRGVNLSEREVEIITLIAKGYTAKEIADKLCLSTHTVNTHKKKIMRKVGVKNIAELVMFAIQEEFILCGISS